MVRIATFNAENLFARYKFASGIPPVRDDGFTMDQLAFVEIDKLGVTRLKGLTIREANADIVCLQEIDSLLALDWFTSLHLGGLRYHHRILVDGNDPRQIDVAVLSRFPINAVRSNRHEWSSDTQLKTFSRDCLEVEVSVEGKPLWLGVNHNKSMSEGRGATKPRRDVQVKRIVEIFDAARAVSRYNGNVVLAGDFNDYRKGQQDTESSLGPLFNHPEIENVVDRIVDAKERYTNFFGGAKTEDEKYNQLDYLFVNKALATSQANKDKKPEILRKGMAYQVTRHRGERFPGIGSDRPKASDHALVWMDIELL